MTDRNKNLRISLTLARIVIGLFAAACSIPVGVKPTSQYPAETSAIETSTFTDVPTRVNTPTLMPEDTPLPTSTHTPSPTNPAPTSTPTSIPYNPFIEWSDEPESNVVIHYEFSKMSKEDVIRFLEVNRNDFTLDSNGLHWITDGSADETKNAEFQIWPQEGIKNDIADVKVHKVIIYYSLIKPETFRFYNVKKMESVFPESTFFSHFECASNDFPVRILSGATKWLLAMTAEKEKPWREQDTLPGGRTLSTNGMEYDWSEKYFITLIPFKFDPKGKPLIFGENLIIQASSSAFDFNKFLEPVDKNKDLFGPDARIWNEFNCYLPSLEYIGFRSELDSGINATIHDIYITGTKK